MNESTNATIAHVRTEIISNPLEPQWGTANTAWKWGWEFHIALFCFSFLVLTIYSLCGIYRSRNRRETVARNLSYVIHALIALLGITRLLTLALFPYEFKSPIVKRPMPVAAARLVFGIGFPCITASFALVQFSFTDSLKGMLSASKLRNLTFLVLVIAMHFAIVLIADIISTNVSNTTAVLCVVTKSYFLLMALVTMIRILMSGLQVLHRARRTSHALKKLNSRYKCTVLSPRGKRKGDPDTDVDKVLFKVRMVIILTCVFCSALIGVQVFSLIELDKVLAGKTGALAPWPWYVYQTIFRLAELGLAGTVLYAISSHVARNTKGVASRIREWLGKISSREKATMSEAQVGQEDAGCDNAENKGYEQSQ
ncbi:predicted protein [Nematostella vectensis]|uniref:Proline-rich transmembrane protein 3/4 domain-containing protein n=1 Tax=Nematostella vectensis TaxID=45351 RepID=A7RL64_NEMVE|nr:uncharacterized protein LOC5520013 [Nematostella vectensis]EDO47807.1 predicted protein [Nematostella vectensis]|eukprot:XP_001639870.1 predicted protein [Nematostella vectensis]